MKQSISLGVLGVFHQQFRRRWSREKRKSDGIESKQTAQVSKLQSRSIHSFHPIHSDLVYISSRAAFISLGTHFPLIKGWIMSVIMIIHILTTLSATQLHHYAYEMQMKYLRKIWIINALHIIMLSCWFGWLLCYFTSFSWQADSQFGSSQPSSECEMQANLDIESWWLFMTTGVLLYGGRYFSMIPH